MLISSLAIWIIVTYYGYSFLTEIDKRLPFLIISNLACVITFIILLNIKNESNSANVNNLLLMSPLMINFAINVS